MNLRIHLIDGSHLTVPDIQATEILEHLGSLTTFTYPIRFTSKDAIHYHIPRDKILYWSYEQL